MPVYEGPPYPMFVRRDLVQRDEAEQFRQWANDPQRFPRFSDRAPITEQPTQDGDDLAALRAFGADPDRFPPFTGRTPPAPPDDTGELLAWANEPGRFPSFSQQQPEGPTQAADAAYRAALTLPGASRAAEPPPAPPAPRRPWDDLGAQWERVLADKARAFMRNPMEGVLGAPPVGAGSAQPRDAGEGIQRAGEAEQQRQQNPLDPWKLSKPLALSTGLPALLPGAPNDVSQEARDRIEGAVKAARGSGRAGRAGASSAPASGFALSAAQQDALRTAAEQAGDIALRLRYASMLANPINAGLDAITTAINIPRAYWRIAGGAAIEALLGVPQGQRSATKGMVGALNKGVAAGLHEASVRALDALVQGTVSRAEQAPPLVRGPAGLAIEGGQRIRAAADMFTRTLGISMGEHTIAQREVERAGFQGQTGAIMASNLVTALRVRAAELATAGVEIAQAGTLPGGRAFERTQQQYLDSLLGEVEAFSRRQIWQAEPGALAGALSKPRAHGLVNFFQPFYRSIADISAQGITATPLGLLGTAADVARGSLLGAGPYGRGVGHVLSGSNTAAVLPASQRAAEGVLGLGIMGVGAALYLSGRATGVRPERGKARQASVEGGTRPLAVDGVPVPLDRLGPLAWPLVSGILLAEAFDRSGGESIPTGAALLAFANRSADWGGRQLPLSGYRDLLELVQPQQPGQRGARVERLAARTITGMLPGSGLLRQLRQVSDQYQRDPDGLLQELANTIPGLSQALPVRRGAFGEPILNSGQAEGAAGDPVRAELLRLNAATGAAVFPSELARTQSGQALGREQYDAVQRQVGAARHAALVRLLATAEYQRAGDAERARLVQRVNDTVRQQEVRRAVPPTPTPVRRVPATRR